MILRPIRCDQMTTATAGAEDRQAILDLVVTYALALDGRDWALLRTVFTPDAVAEYRGYGDSIGYDAIELACRAALERLTSSQHLLGNHLITFADGEARGVCYVQATHVDESRTDESMYTIGGRYEDRVIRTSEGWRIAHRTLSILWSTGNVRVVQG
jgi:hypothetical protein